MITMQKIEEAQKALKELKENAAHKIILIDEESDEELLTIPCIELEEIE